MRRRDVALEQYAEAGSAFPLLDLMTANQLRDRGMLRVSQHAEDYRPNFSADAQAFILRYLGEHGPTSGEVLTAACNRAGISPHDDRAFGGVYFGLAKRGLIVKVGECRRRRGHGTAGGSIWSLATQLEA